MRAHRLEVSKVSKHLAREMGVGGKAFRLFLLGAPAFSLATISNDDIRRSLKYADEAVNHREHSQVPVLLMIV